METVPVTLGAALPGTTGAPPLFGKAVGVNKNAGPAAGTFLQELQNMVAESYGAAKLPNKTGQPAKQNEKPHDEGEKIQNSPGSIPIPVPVAVPLPTLVPATAPTPAPQSTSHIVSTNGDAALTQSVKAETKSQVPGVSVFPAANSEIVNTENSVPLSTPVSPATELTKNKTVQDHLQVQEQVVSQPVPQLIADEQIKIPDLVAPLSVSAVPQPDVEPAVSRTTHEPFSPVVEKAARPAKDVHVADGRGKTVDRPSLQPEARISEMPVSNSSGIVTAPVISSEKHPDGAQKTPSIGKQPNFQSDVAAPIVDGVKPESKTFTADGTHHQLQIPPVQSVQEQNTSSTAKPANLNENAQFLKLVIGETPRSNIDTHLAVSHLPTNVQLRENMQPKKLDFQRTDFELPGLHKFFVPDTKPLINDQPLSRDIQLEVKTGHAEAKTSESPQKTNIPTNGHDDAVTAIAAPTLAHTPVQAESANNSNGAINVQQPTTLIPNTHVPPSSPAPMGKPEAPSVASPDSPVLPLPSEKIQAVRMVDRLGQAEMHLGMRTETFGSVQVHTVIRDSQVGLTIGSERGDLKTYLAAEVFGLESNLRQHDLHFADVRFVGSSFSPGDQYGGAGSQPQSFQQGRSFPHAQARFVLQPGSANEIEIVKDQTVGLSVHA